MFLMYEDPRMPCSEIAERLGISRQAANHRVQALAKLGFFKKTKATISAYYSDAVIVGIWGRSKTTSIRQTLDRLGESEFTSRAVVAGANFLYVVGALRDLSELEAYAEFVKRAAEMSEPTVGVYSLNAGIMPDWIDGGRRKQSYRELSPLDLKIIASLKNDARRPTAEIADMVGVSTRTVNRHLDYMRSSGSMDFDSPWDPASGEDMYTLLFVDLKEGADKVKVGRRLLSMDTIKVIMMRSFSNLPNSLLGLVCSNRMTEIRRIIEGMSEDEDVMAVTPNLLYYERQYMTWDERSPSYWARRPGSVKRRAMRSNSGTR